MAENYLERLKSHHQGWRQFFDALQPDQHQLLLDLLRALYREEAQDAMQFAQHVERMHYPQFRRRLRYIVAQEQGISHGPVAWRSGAISPTSHSPRRGLECTWGALLRDLEEEKRSYVELLEAMHLAEEVDPELAEGLRRIREEEQHHREEILEMLEKSDPYTLPQGPSEENPSAGPVQGRQHVASPAAHGLVRSSSSYAATASGRCARRADCRLVCSFPSSNMQSVMRATGQQYAIRLTTGLPGRRGFRTAESAVSDLPPGHPILELALACIGPSITSILPIDWRWDVSTARRQRE